MKDMRSGKEVVRQPSDPLPSSAIFLTAAPKRACPKIDDAEAECDERATVCRHRLLIEESGDDLLQSLPLSGDRLMHSPAQLLFDGLQFRPHAVGSRLPFDLELARRDLPLMKMKPRKLKVSG